MLTPKAAYRLILVQDLAFIVLSIVVAIALVKTGVLESVLTMTRELDYLGSFLAGLFFTSIFTTAPAIVTLGEIAQLNGIWTTALFGALGAVAGDLVIFRFIKDGLSEHVAQLRSAPSPKVCLEQCLKNRRMFRWITFVAGGLVIASPLPDELGVSMLGMSKMRLAMFVPISLAFNFLGILAIGLVASAL